MKKILITLLFSCSSFAFADSTQYCSGRKQSCCVSPSQGLGPSWLDGECSQYWSQGLKYIPNNSCKKNCANANKAVNSSVNSNKTANATYVKCSGSDTTGKSVYLITYPNSSTVNINGDMLNIVGTTRNGQGVVTQNFLSVYGILVYDSIVPVNSNSLTIYQFNAVTQALLAQAWLTCTFYNYNNVSTPNVIDHQIFNSIKTDSMQSTGAMPYNK